jgi:hypothetical protein
MVPWIEGSAHRKPNIFDNMMAIMEKYANNLEEIVEERTDQLREEKKKTEELLHQMLPWYLPLFLVCCLPMSANPFCFTFIIE